MLPLRMLGGILRGIFNSSGGYLMAILTDTKARSIKPEDKPLAHGGVTGLTLHPSTAKGRGKWVLRIPTHGDRSITFMPIT